MAAFGEELRRQRELQGLPVEAICDATKVPSRYILALEAGEFRELPGGVFRRGFVRSYLATLGLDQDIWMKRFEEACRELGVVEPEDTAWATFAENVKNSRRVIRHQMRARWFGLLAMVLGLLLAGWCCWRLISHRSLIPARPKWIHLKSSIDKPSAT